MSYSIAQGFKFQIDLGLAINKRAQCKINLLKNYFLFSEDELKKKFGTCKNTKGKNIVGVDILCFIDNDIYAIQCKQHSKKVPKQGIQDFLDYCIFLEQKFNKRVIKVFSSSAKSSGPGNALGDHHGVIWVIYPNTDVLIHNTVSWLFDRKEYLDNDGDCVME
jgi:hypothetical protein